MVLEGHQPVVLVMNNFGAMNSLSVYNTVFSLSPPSLLSDLVPLF